MTNDESRKEMGKRKDFHYWITAMMEALSVCLSVCLSLSLFLSLCLSLFLSLSACLSFSLSLSLSLSLSVSLSLSLSLSPPSLCPPPLVSPQKGGQLNMLTASRGSPLKITLNSRCISEDGEGDDSFDALVEKFSTAIKFGVTVLKDGDYPSQVTHVFVVRGLLPVVRWLFSSYPRYHFPQLFHSREACTC